MDFFLVRLDVNRFVVKSHIHLAMKKSKSNEVSFPERDQRDSQGQTWRYWNPEVLQIDSFGHVGSMRKGPPTTVKLEMPNRYSLPDPLSILDTEVSPCDSRHR